MSVGLPRGVVVCAVMGALLAAAASVRADVPWRKGSQGCEPPGVFYSSAHQPGRGPCCPLQPGVCPGGGPCPGSGLCPSGERCVPGVPADRPNVLLFIADDQGACHYGSAAECRSAQTGTSIPAPKTPNLDRLAADGTVFPIAHNTAAWCYPSLNSILTGRYQKSFGGSRARISERFVTLPGAVRSLGEAPGTVVDPYDSTARAGGYCTYLGGKFTGAAGRPVFDAGERGSGRRLGRIDCVAAPNGGPPRCGTDASSTYDPSSQPFMSDVLEFMDAMPYQAPGGGGTFRVQPFFVWYAPRIPHQPLDAPPVVRQYLFGGDGSGLGGAFDLGGYCGSGGCPPMVRAFDETNFGTVREYYANVLWTDANLGELRKFLERASAPHCRRPRGARWDVSTPGACGGTWVQGLAPAPDRNTVIVYLSDNGWHLPNAKHNFTENGYRTRMLVLDPRSVPAGGGVPYESPAVAHSTDVLPTVLGFALGTPGSQACPTSADGTPCDGRDLRPHLAGAPGGPAPAETLRHGLCGHHTQRGTSPSRQRYFLTRPGSVGRCLVAASPACTGDADCGPNGACAMGRCLATGESGCTRTSQCPPGAACLAGRCQVAPPCLNDATCARLLPGQGASCAAKGQGWCRNAPLRACSTAGDCPSCPLSNGKAVACGRVCEPRVLKLYLPPGDGGSLQLVDLFADPDERSRTGRTVDPALNAISDPAGPYGDDIRAMACCVDEWWPEGRRGGSFCPAGGTCPADLSCTD